MKVDYELLAKLGRAVLEDIEEVSENDMLDDLEHRTRDKYLDLVAMNAASLLFTTQAKSSGILMPQAGQPPVNLRGMQ